MKKILIVGGTSGLGFALARLLAKKSNGVFVTGRKNPEEKNIHYIFFDINNGSEKLATDLDRVIENTGPIDILVHAAGFSQIGTITDIEDSGIETTINTVLQAPAMLMRRILRKQGVLDGFIAITSTSQWIPRLEEPIYCSSKAGLAMLANSLSLDGRIGKVLVAGPAGMATPFWRNNSRDTSILLDPEWVAGEIMASYDGDFRFKSVRILRDPPRTEELEKRL